MKRICGIHSWAINLKIAISKIFLKKCIYKASSMKASVEFGLRMSKLTKSKLFLFIVNSLVWLKYMIVNSQTLGTISYIDLKTGSNTSLPTKWPNCVYS
mgnify:CR=1 FL=1